MMEDLEEYIGALKVRCPSIYEAFNRIYEVGCSHGSLKVTGGLEKRFDKNFIESVKEQKIIRVYNRWTGEGALFNSFRLKKPVMDHGDAKKILKELLRDDARCDFCMPELYTPEDDFGRVRGQHSITASNIAKYDAWSGLLIFRKHNPLDFSFEELSDYLSTASKWFELAAKSSGFRFPFIVWNCMPRAGASQIHGHMQLLLGERPYGKVSFLEEASRRYLETYGSSYQDDVFRVHSAIGLGAEYGDVSVYASITPVKEREINITFKSEFGGDRKLQMCLFKILRCLIDEAGVCSFNLSIHPFNQDMNIPGIIRIVDRGSITSKSSDIGGMELFGSSVIGSDPYMIFDKIKGVLDA
ncbi:hypothetical protein DNK57_02115 [Methanothermobacter thermautotrophicus]|uniref:Galactose-1-phosphate uridylyltransferase n=2 Tax=Methanothermobacter thermautotrophicus TaxID=145262 RepID=A0A842YJU4_METTF|nr:hypothetical protein [Methanothermobacter thermautotrophicus]